MEEAGVLVSAGAGCVIVMVMRIEYFLFCCAVRIDPPAAGRSSK